MSLLSYGGGVPTDVRCSSSAQENQRKPGASVDHQDNNPASTSRRECDHQRRGGAGAAEHYEGSRGAAAADESGDAPSISSIESDLLAAVRAQQDMVNWVAARVAPHTQAPRTQPFAPPPPMDPRPAATNAPPDTSEKNVQRLPYSGEEKDSVNASGATEAERPLAQTGASEPLSAVAAPQQKRVSFRGLASTSGNRSTAAPASTTQHRFVSYSQDRPPASGGNSGGVADLVFSPATQPPPPLPPTLYPGDVRPSDEMRDVALGGSVGPDGGRPGSASPFMVSPEYAAFLLSMQKEKHAEVVERRRREQRALRRREGRRRQHEGEPAPGDTGASTPTRRGKQQQHEDSDSDGSSEEDAEDEEDDEEDGYYYYHHPQDAGGAVLGDAPPRGGANDAQATPPQPTRHQRLSPSQDPRFRSPLFNFGPSAKDDPSLRRRPQRGNLTAAPAVAAAAKNDPSDTRSPPQRRPSPASKKSAPLTPARGDASAAAIPADGPAVRAAAAPPAEDDAGDDSPFRVPSSIERVSPQRFQSPLQPARGPPHGVHPLLHHAQQDHRRRQQQYTGAVGKTTTRDNANAHQTDVAAANAAAAGGGHFSAFDANHPSYRNADFADYYGRPAQFVSLAADPLYAPFQSAYQPAAAAAADGAWDDYDYGDALASHDALREPAPIVLNTSWAEPPQGTSSANPTDQPQQQQLEENDKKTGQGRPRKARAAKKKTGVPRAAARAANAPDGTRAAQTVKKDKTKKVNDSARGGSTSGATPFEAFGEELWRLQTSAAAAPEANTAEQRSTTVGDRQRPLQREAPGEHTPKRKELDQNNDEFFFGRKQPSQGEEEEEAKGLAAKDGTGANASRNRFRAPLQTVPTRTLRFCIDSIWKRSRPTRHALSREPSPTSGACRQQHQQQQRPVGDTRDVHEQRHHQPGGSDPRQHSASASRGDRAPALATGSPPPTRPPPPPPLRTAAAAARAGYDSSDVGDGPTRDGLFFGGRQQPYYRASLVGSAVSGYLCASAAGDRPRSPSLAPPATQRRSRASHPTTSGRGGGARDSSVRRSSPQPHRSRYYYYATGTFQTDGF